MATTLADLRKAADMTQSQVAQRMGVGRSRITQIEQDYPNLTFTVVMSYIQALGGHVALTGIAGHTVPADDVQPTHRDPGSRHKKRQLQRQGLRRLDALDTFSRLPAEELPLQTDQPDTGGDDTGRKVDHADAQGDHGDSGQRKQP